MGATMAQFFFKPDSGLKKICAIVAPITTADATQTMVYDSNAYALYSNASELLAPLKAIEMVSDANNQN